MFGTRNTKRVLLAVLATLFVVGFAYQASAFESAGNTPFTYTGKIVALSDNGMVVTVQSAAGEKAFNLQDKTEILKCDMAASAHDLKIGDNVTISYFDKGDGTLVGSSLTYWSEGMRC